MKRIILPVMVSVFLFSTMVSAKELSTSQSAEVKASAADVWALLVNADHWSHWNPAVKSSKLIKGNGEDVGSRVRFVPVIGGRKSPIPVKLTLDKSERPEKLEYKARVAGTNIIFGFSVEDVEGKEGVIRATSYETIKGVSAALYSQEGLDKEHEVWVDSIKKKLEKGDMSSP